jgi:tetratricopeptide (TPR) repeat protein
MVKHLSHFKRLALIAGTVAALFVAPQACCQGANPDEAALHTQQGQAYFKEGFYGHAPKGRVAEAERSYGLAARELRAAIAQDPTNLDAHRNLARVYHIQKDFAGAAEQYQRVTELAPFDLDAYVNQSLALIELKRLDDAIQALERAKGATSDPKALKTLDGYIARIRSHQGEEVK